MLLAELLHVLSVAHHTGALGHDLLTAIQTRGLYEGLALALGQDIHYLCMCDALAIYYIYIVLVLCLHGCCGVYGEHVLECHRG